MTLPLRIRPEAKADLLDACRWYEEQARGLGDAFLVEIERLLVRIEESPEAFPVVHQQAHRALLRRFPYGVYYLRTADEGILIAVLHLARDPERLTDRLGPG